MKQPKAGNLYDGSPAFCFRRVHSGARAQNFHKCVAHVRKTARRMFPAGRFGVMLRAYQRTVRGAAVKELNVAVASVSANTCVLPSSAAYMLCSSG